MGPLAAKLGNRATDLLNRLFPQMGQDGES